MRQTNRWSVVVAVGTLFVGVACVASPVGVVRALTIFSQIGADINGKAASDESGASVAMSADGTRIAIGAAFNDDNGSNSGHVRIYSWNGTAWTQTGADINGENAGDLLGASVAMSADGTRIAISANSNDDNGSNSGHVRIYTWNGTAWTQTGADINGENVDDRSGTSVAMSADGTRIAIGAPFNDDNGSNSGHVRIYSWNGTAWTQTGTDINGENAGDWSGESVALSADGTRIAIGAAFNDDNGSNSGHVRIYTWNGTAWTQTGTDINGEAAGDRSGRSVAISADGTRVAIGAHVNSGGGDAAGQVRIYTWNGTAWTQTGADIDGEAADDESGRPVAISANGTRIAIGAPYNDGTASDAGHVRIYEVLNTPAAPTITSINATSGTLTVSFTPGIDGGSPITNYKYSVDGTNYVAINPATITSPFTISGLSNGTTYSVTIKAVNRVGDSPVSNAITGTPLAPASPTTTVAQPVAPVIRIAKSTSAKSIATYARLTVVSTSKLSLKVSPSTAKNCKVSGTFLKGVKAGTCKVTVTVTPKKGKAMSKTVSLKVTK